MEMGEGGGGLWGVGLCVLTSPLDVLCVELGGLDFFSVRVALLGQLTSS